MVISKIKTKKEKKRIDRLSIKVYLALLNYLGRYTV